MIAWLTSKAVWVAGIALAVLGAIAAVWSRGRAAGAADEKLKQNEAKDALEDRYRRVDGDNRSFDDAVVSLRDRQRRG